MWHQIHNQRAIVENREIANRFSIGQGTVVDFDSLNKIVQNITKENASWIKLKSEHSTGADNKSACCQLTEDLIGYFYQLDSTSRTSYAVIYSISQGKMVGESQVDTTASKVYHGPAWGCHKIADNMFVVMGNSSVFWVTFNPSTGAILDFTQKGQAYYGSYYEDCCWIDDTTNIMVGAYCDSDEYSMDCYVVKNVYDANTKTITSTPKQRGSSSVYFSANYTSSWSRGMAVRKLDSDTVLWAIPISKRFNSTSTEGGVWCTCFTIKVSNLSIIDGNTYKNVVTLNNNQFCFDSANIFITKYGITMIGRGQTKTGTLSYSYAILPYNGLVVTGAIAHSISGDIYDDFFLAYNEDKEYLAGIFAYDSSGGTIGLGLLKINSEVMYLDKQGINNSTMRYIPKYYYCSLTFVSSSNIQLFVCDNQGLALTAQIQGKKIGRKFNNSSTTAIALADGESGDVIPVILEGTLYQDWVTTSTQIRSAGINGQGIVDKWLNVIPKWQYQLLKA